MMRRGKRFISRSKLVPVLLGNTWVKGAATLQPAEAAAFDDMIFSGAADTNYGISSVFNAGGETGGKIYKGLLLFDLSSIPDNATVEIATLTLYCESESETTDLSIGVHRALKVWYEGSKNAEAPDTGEYASTWNLRNAGRSLAWTDGVQGGKSGSDYAASATATTSITGVGAFTWDVTADVLAWIARTSPNLGWFVIAVTPGDNNRKRFTSSTGATAANRPKLAVSYRYNSASPIYKPGTWSWFHKPLAIYSNNKTFWSGIDYDGRLIAYEYNHTTNAVSSFILRQQFEIDDHDAASFLIRQSDSKLIAFYTAHDDSGLRLRISTNAEDISAWGAETNLDSSIGDSDYTYPTPIQLDGEANDPIYLFYRGADPGVNDLSLFYSKSTDGGATWAGLVKVFANTNERPYFSIAQNGTARIDFAVTDGHPNEVATNSVYHFYYQGGSYYQTDGTLICNTAGLPVTPAGATKVYDGTTNRAWVYDIAIDGDGYPVIVYVVYQGGDTDDQRYRYARWTGAAWVDNQIVAAGGAFVADDLATLSQWYTGGICLDRGDPDVCYLSKLVSGQWEIYKYETADNGANWTATALTTGSAAKNFRPIVPFNSVAGLKVLWCYGTYVTYLNYNTVFKSSPQYPT